MDILRRRVTPRLGRGSSRVTPRLVEVHGSRHGWDAEVRSRLASARRCQVCPNGADQCGWTCKPCDGVVTKGIPCTRDENCPKCKGKFGCGHVYGPTTEPAADADGKLRCTFAAWAFRGDESRRRRGCDVDIPWRRVAAAPRPRRGSSAETGARLRYEPRVHGAAARQGEEEGRPAPERHAAHRVFWMFW